MTSIRRPRDRSTGNTSDYTPSICEFKLQEKDSAFHRGRKHKEFFSTPCVFLAVATSLLFATCTHGMHHRTAFIATHGNHKSNFRNQARAGGDSFQMTTRHYGQIHSFRMNKYKKPSFLTSSRNTNIVLQMTETETEKPKRGRPRDAPEDDEVEWRTILAAFQMYKAAYGDLKVPSRFVVPGMAPWPEPAWKMKLGQRVAAIRSTGRYVQNNEARRKILDDMGFLWRLRVPSTGKKLDGIAFEQVYDALKVYRDEVQPKGGILDMPPNYVVPDCDPWPDSTRGLPLGKILPTVTSRSYLKNNPEAEGMLTKLGFRMDAKSASNDLRYQKVYDALVKYKELYGDLLVPQPFTVPENSDEWPESTWGLRLGARVNAIRSQGTFVKTEPLRKEELDELGFVWEPPVNTEGKRRGRKRKSELEDESSDEGGVSEDDCSDEVSDGASTPFGESDRGSDGGFDITKDAFFTGDKPPQWHFEGEDDEDDLLSQKEEPIVYQEEKPFNETLAEMAEMAMSIGIMQGWTSNKRVIKKARDKYVPWHNDDFGGDFVFEDVVEALTLYKQLYKNFDDIEETEFVVPEPVEESLRLSPFELAAMNSDSSDDFDDIDGPWDEDQDDDALENKFSVVASTDWPEHLGGMTLGRIVRRMRDGDLEVKHLPERKAKLDAIGFDWGDPKRFIDVPFDKCMCALYAYYMIRGDTAVVKDFVMPGEQPWPKVLEGFELGAVVVRLRELQNFLEAYHPVKMTLLKMFDFIFFPELALPLDPDADEVSWEHEYAESFGHPLYNFFQTPPLGLPEKIMAMGPNENGSWYNYEYIKEFYGDGPGQLYSVADVMRDMGFPVLAEEHEEKYGQSAWRKICLLKEKLDGEGMAAEDYKKEWDQGITRISQEIIEEFENWKEDTDGLNLMDLYNEDGEMDDDTYYNLLSSISGAPDASAYERPLISNPSRDVIEEPVAEFSLNDDKDNQ